MSKCALCGQEIRTAEAEARYKRQKTRAEIREIIRLCQSLGDMKPFAKKGEIVEEMSQTPSERDKGV